MLFKRKVNVFVNGGHHEYGAIVIPSSTFIFINHSNHVPNQICYMCAIAALAEGREQNL